LILYSFDLYLNKQETFEQHNNNINLDDLIEYCKLIIQVIKSNLIENAPGIEKEEKDENKNEKENNNANEGTEKKDKKHKKSNNAKSNGHNISKEVSQNIGFYNNLINMFGKFSSFICKLKDKESLLKNEKLTQKLSKITSLLEAVLEKYNMKNLFSKITQFKEKLSI